MVYPAITTVVPSATPSVSLTTARTVGSSGAVAAFDIVALDSSGQVVLAEASQVAGLYEATGVAQGSGAVGATIEIVEIQGVSTSMTFAAAPAAAANGQPVFLSTTPGQATLTPPTTAGNIVFRVGILAGADGATLTPSVIWRPRFVSWVL